MQHFGENGRRRGLLFKTGKQCIVRYAIIILHKSNSYDYNSKYNKFG